MDNEQRIIPPVLQFAITMGFYVLHLFVLTQRQVTFPFQLIPNDKGHFCSIGYDSLAGIASVTLYKLSKSRRRRIGMKQKQPNNDSVAPRPWSLPNESRRLVLSSIVCFAILVKVYFSTGRLSIFWEDCVYNLSGLGFYITSPIQRSLCVLLGHLSWVCAGCFILKFLPRPPKFFQQPGDDDNGLKADATPPEGKDESQTSAIKPPATYRWFTSNVRNTNWLWWVIGGYYVSSWLFNIADGINQYVLPSQVLDDAQESVVTQLVNPEHNDVLASVLGYIAPCLSAPWFEEILYRGFCLPMLTRILGSYPLSVFIQGVIFSVHHMSITATLPLAVLGWLWAVLYTKSKNLWTVVFIHALWNSRVFLGSWLGL